MAVRPDPEVGFRRPGDHLRVERPGRATRVHPGAAAGRLGDAPRSGGDRRPLLPELHLGPAEPAWPAAATTRSARARLGLLRETARVESLEARPESIFRVRVTRLGLRERVAAGGSSRSPAARGSSTPRHSRPMTAGPASSSGSADGPSAAASRPTCERSRSDRLDRPWTSRDGRCRRARGQAFVTGLRPRGVVPTEHAARVGLPTTSDARRRRASRFRLD